MSGRSPLVSRGIRMLRGEGSPSMNWGRGADGECGCPRKTGGMRVRLCPCKTRERYYERIRLSRETLVEMVVVGFVGRQVDIGLGKKLREKSGCA